MCLNPLLWLQYEMKGGKVQWSSSNFFESLRQIIEGERAVDAEPLPAEASARPLVCPAVLTV